MVILAGGLAFAQEAAKPQDVVAGATDTAFRGKVITNEGKTLTESEKKDVALAMAKRENHSLQMQLLIEKFNQTPEAKQLAEAGKALNAEESKLITDLAKAHGVDLKTHRLNKDGTGFEPIPSKAEVKK